MYVLVTGVTDCIALHVVDQLLKQSYKVNGTVRSQEKFDKLIRQFNENPNMSGNCF